MRFDRTRLAAGFVTWVVMLTLSGAAHAAAAYAGDDLGDLSLDELMGITVTSASKKEQRADEVASAIFVLTQEDIHRSGATSIPEALRLVPGVQVARVNANSWAITSRGFNGRFASKLLVLIDGRSVYTPLFSGVYWDVQDTLLEDVERIEVIRGPGATVWGSNAVNGVINIITKSAKDTHGAYAHAAGGTEERANTALRWGGAVGEDFHYRGYAKYLKRDTFQDGSGRTTNDAMDQARGGFRVDWDVTDRDLVTLQGDYYDGDSGMTFTGLPGFQAMPVRFNEDQQVQGGNFIGRWTRRISETMETSFQFYYDRTERTTPLIDEKRDTFDFEFQHSFELPGNQEVIWGGGYRYTQDTVDNTFALGVLPDERHDDTFSLFIQDEISFFDDRLNLTFGTKIEKNDYTGWEYQPSLRVLGKPFENHTVWAAVSRAVRVPSRADQDVFINTAFEAGGMPGSSALLGGVPCAPFGLPFGICPNVLLQATGARDEFAERVYAFEAGYRTRFLERFTLDLAAFYNEYNYLQTTRVGGQTVLPSMPIPTVVQNIFLANRETAETYGLEVDFRADLLDWWRVIVAYTYLYNREGFPDPTHYGNVRSQMDLPFDLQLDVILYMVGNIRVAGSGSATLSSGSDVDSYERLDLRLGWKPAEHWELEIVGQNLIEQRHEEFDAELGISAAEVQRGVYGQVTFRY